MQIKTVKEGLVMSDFREHRMIGLTPVREYPKPAYADVYRLDFMCNVLMQDPAIRITECGVPQPLLDAFLPVNGKSGDRCKTLRERLFDNGARRLPVVLFSNYPCDPLKKRVSTRPYETRVYAYRAGNL